MFSIIIPVHNAEKYIERCVQSLLTQPVSIQVILVENGSADDSLTKCKNLSKNYTNVEIYKSEKIGASSARNEGMKYVRGDIVGFCDADDYYEENSLKLVESLFEHTNADIIITAINLITHGITKRLSVKNDTFIDTKLAIDYITCNPVVMGSACNKFYKQSLAKYISFPEWSTHLEDGYMNVRLLSMSRNSSVYVSKLCTYNYVINENSASNVIAKCFDDNGMLNYNKTLYSLLDNANLHVDEIPSIYDQIFRLSIDWFWIKNKELSTIQKKLLYNEINNFWTVYLHRLFRYDWFARIRYLIKGMIILLGFIK